MQAKILSSTEDITQEEWLKLRSQGIGGSDAATACGLSRWKTPTELWLEKTGQVQPKKLGEAAYWGKRLEPIIREEFILRTGIKVYPKKAILQHPLFPFMLANIDGIAIDPDYGEGLFEAKTTGLYFKKEWTHGIPEEYMLQVQHYLSVTCFAFCYVAVLIGGNQFKWKLVFRNDEAISLLIELEAKFWEAVQTLSPPTGNEVEVFFLRKILKGGLVHE